MIDLQLAKQNQEKYRSLMFDYYYNNNRKSRDEAYELLYNICKSYIYNKYRKVMNHDDLEDLSCDVFVYQCSKEQRRVEKVGPDKGIAIALYQELNYSFLTVYYAKKWRNKYYDEKLLDLVKETVDYDTINSQ